MNANDKRVILRRISTEAVSASVLADQVRRGTRVKVVDEKPDSLLLAGDEHAVDSLVAQTRGWIPLEMHKVRIPDTRPRVLGPPTDE